MPISARLSLWGLYQYDSTILDNLTVPTGLDANNIKQNLLVETAGMTVLYPDPNFLKVAIGLWATERRDIWHKLYNTTLLTYDPVENYDRFEETEEQSDGVSVRANESNRANEHSRNANSSGVALRDNEQSRDSDSSSLNSDISTQSGDSQTTNANTAYDSNTFADTSKSTSNGTNNTSNSGTSSSNSHDSITSGEKESKNENSSEKLNESETLNESGNESNSNVRKFSSHIHGNIGVKTASAMIMEAREEMQFCMTEYIINDVINKFCVMVY